MGGQKGGGGRGRRRTRIRHQSQQEEDTSRLTFTGCNPQQTNHMERETLLFFVQWHSTALVREREREVGISAGTLLATEPLPLAPEQRRRRGGGRDAGAGTSALFHPYRKERRVPIFAGGGGLTLLFVCVRLYRLFSLSHSCRLLYLSASFHPDPLLHSL